jgi:hypothetical protein
MRSSVILFANDLVDEGFDNAIDTIRNLAQADALTMACNYHHSRDVLPHNPRRRIVYMRGGVYFQPDQARFAKMKIKPDVVDFAREEDPLAKLVATARKRGMVVRAWTNGTHSTIQASAHLDCAVQNAFGDAYITSLCPANPDVRAYLCTLNSEFKRYEVQALLAESLCFMPFDHGYHHERSMVPLSPAVKFVLGLCFCQYCRAAGQAAGVDSDKLAAFVRREVDLSLNSRPSALDNVPVDHGAIAALAGGDMNGYLKGRQRSVTTLIEELVEAVSPLPVDLMEWSGGLRAVGAGMQIGTPTGAAVNRSWQDGVDVGELPAACHGLSVQGYVPSPEVLRAELKDYRAAMPKGKALSVCLRPMWPDCDSVDVLRAKLRMLEESGAEWVDFYHFAFMPLEHLSWIGKARDAVARQ